MHSRVLALSALALVCSLPATEAFGSTPGCALPRGGAQGSAISRAALRLRASRSPRAPLALSADSGVPEGQKAFEAAERSMDEWFSMLADRYTG